MNENRLEISEEMIVLLRYLVRSGKLTEVRLDGLLDEACLSRTKLMALRYLRESESPVSLSQLATHLTFVKSNITQIVDRLEAENLVHRVADPTDRRSTILELTEEGRQHCEIGLQVLAPLESELSAIYSPEERQQLCQLLKRIDKVWG